MQRSRWPWLLIGLGLLAIAWAPPAAAEQAGANLTLTVSRLWNQGGRPGSWSPYLVTVRNDGQATFTGTAALIPDSGFRALPGTFPEYDVTVVVPASGQRAATVYALEPANGYHAELRDEQGSVLTSASVSGTRSSGAAVAVLSDVPQVQQRLDALLRSRSRLDAAVTQLPAGQAFPADAIGLTGLNAVVLDQFDTGSLDPAQLRALADFVGLGGTLVVTGGGGARRTLDPLPADLVPLSPTGAGTASLAPLGELSGITTTASAAVTTGDVAATARVALAAPDGTPLVVERAYGAGDVVELTFDPLVAPFDGQLDLAAAAWAQALTRGLSAASGSGSSQLAGLGFGGGPTIGGPPVGSGPGSAGGYPGYLDQALAEAPAAAAPPFGLLAGLLAVYVLVISALVYWALRAIGRRGLLWVVVPAVAVACTAGAYLFGFGTRGSDFQMVQVQVERLAPGGTVETAEFDGVLTPRRGDVTVTTSGGALVTTARAAIGPYTTNGDTARIKVASAPLVTFPNVAVWDMRPVQTLSVAHEGAAAAAMPIEARLRVHAGLLTGQVVNHGSRQVRGLELVSPTGAQMTLAASLDPGATADVGVPVVSGSASLPLGKGGGFAVPAAVFAPASAQTALSSMITLASTEVAVRPGEWALVGQVDRTGTLRIGGELPRTTGRALVVEPVTLLSSDSAAGAPPTRLVSAYTTPAGAAVEVFEQAVPQDLTVRVALTASLLPGRPPTTAPSLEVYDWEAQAWRAMPGFGAPTPLTAGALRGGTVRARVISDGGQVTLSLSDLP